MSIHPRPQLTRERLQLLDGPWQFQFDDGDIGMREGWPTKSGAEKFDRQIIVPFPPESQASGIGDRDPKHHLLWYRRTFAVPEEWGSTPVVLHFGAVDYTADVWVNGVHVAHHEGGHTPFSSDISQVLADGQQTVVVRCEDRLDADQPRGKQAWEPEPSGIFYNRTSGIWQSVWLEPVPEQHIASIRWTPDAVGGTVALELAVAGALTETTRARVRLSIRGQVVVDDHCSLRQAINHRRFDLPTDASITGSPHSDFTWRPEHPNLFEADITLIDGDTVLDKVGSYFGLRSVSTEEGRFMLNGSPYYCRLVLAQGFWPESHLASPDADALRREVELIKEHGFNGVRMHQKVEDPQFLYWCDRLGLLVWEEMPSAYSFTRRAIERVTAEWTEVLRRDYSHPCIVLWLPFNESWGVPSLGSDKQQQAYVRGIYNLTHALDSTRPVMTNDGWENVGSDLWGIHDYSTNPQVLVERYGTTDALERTLHEVQPFYRALAAGGSRRRAEPVMITEFGGISLTPPNDGAVMESAVELVERFGYGFADDAEELFSNYERLVSTMLKLRPISGFCYTQFADVETETNGLVSSRRVPKVDPARIRAINTRASAAVPGDVVLESITSGYTFERKA